MKNYLNEILEKLNLPMKNITITEEHFITRIYIKNELLITIIQEKDCYITIDTKNTFIINKTSDLIDFVLNKLKGSDK